MADPVFFNPSRDMTVADIAALTGAQLKDPEQGTRIISRLASLDTAQTGALIFLDNKKYLDQLHNSAASAILCLPELGSRIHPDIAVLETRQPKRDFSMVGRILFPDAAHPVPVLGDYGISKQAHIHETAHLEEGVTVEAGAAIGKNVVIGAGTIIAAGAVVGANCQIGRDSFIGSNVVVQYALIGNRVFLHSGVKIGQDGFGYVGGANGAEKVPQIGRIILQDDVEIGANTTLDRGALGDTIVGEGTKIDNQVQIGHNVRIGRHVLIAAQCGISGSVVIGDGSILGGSAGIADHIKIGRGVTIAAASGVMNDIPDGQKWGGSPARPFKQWFREVAAIRSMSQSGREK